MSVFCEIKACKQVDALYFWCLNSVRKETGVKSHRYVAIWTTSEVKRLRLCVDSGMTAKKIHKAGLISRHTEGGIGNMISKLGIAKIARERTMRAHKNSKVRRKEILEYLGGPGRLIHSDVAANQLGISQEMVQYYRRKNGLKLPNRMRYTSEKYIRSHREILPALSRGLRRHRESFWYNRSCEMYRELNRDAEQHAIKGYLVCRKCGKKWPPDSRYFYFDRRNGSERTIQNCCRACGWALTGNGNKRKSAA